MSRVPRVIAAAGVVWALSVAGATAQAEPSLEARDQRPVENFVVVDSVVAPEPGWVDIHAEAEVGGNPGQVIGYAPVQPGENNYVFVLVDAAKITPVLYAVLHADRGLAGTFEFPGADEPVKVGSRSVTAAFHVLTGQTRMSAEPPGLEVRDQALRNGEVVVGRVVAAQAGFVDIHAEAEQAGNPGPVIGYGPVAAGETTYVRVAVPADKVTPVLYAVLHVDAGERGAFEFPGPDAPVQRDGRAITASFRVLQPHARADQAPAASPTPARAATPSATAAATRTAEPVATAAATETRRPTATRTATATPSPAPTATEPAVPTAADTSTGTATLTPAHPAPSAAASSGGATRAATSESASTLTPLGGSAAQEAGGRQGILPVSLPRTGGGLGPAAEFAAPLAVGLAVLLILAGLVLRRGRRGPA